MVPSDGKREDTCYTKHLICDFLLCVFKPESWCNKLSIKQLRKEKKFQGQLQLNKIKNITS